MKIVVYTCITNDKDTLKPLNKEKGVDYVCFSDKLIKSDTWEIKKSTNDSSDPRRNARKHKILSHKYFPDYDYSIWVDGSIFPSENIKRLIESLNTDVGVFKHQDRDCLYKEAHTCIYYKLDEEDKILSQIDKYSREGYPEKNGLVESRVLVRKHTKEVNEFNELWWNELINGSRRDQISFNYCIWKLGMKYSIIPREGFVYKDHRHER